MHKTWLSDLPKGFLFKEKNVFIPAVSIWNCQRLNFRSLFRTGARDSENSSLTLGDLASLFTQEEEEDEELCMTGIYGSIGPEESPEQLWNLCLIIVIYNREIHFVWNFFYLLVLVDTIFLFFCIVVLMLGSRECWTADSRVAGCRPRCSSVVPLAQPWKREITTPIGHRSDQDRDSLKSLPPICHRSDQDRDSLVDVSDWK